MKKEEPINHPSKSRRSLKANGPKLRMLRVAVGLTQEELAEHVGYSDRLIRKAELGGRIDLKTVRALHQYFIERGQDVELSTLTTTESAQHGQEIPQLWLGQAYVQPDIDAVIGLLGDKCVIRVDGIFICRDRVRGWLIATRERFSRLEMAIDFRASQGAWHVLGWTSTRRLSGDDHDTDSADAITICGMTSFRVAHQQIIEIREFSDSALYLPDHLQWLTEVVSSSTSSNSDPSVTQNNKSSK